MKSVLSCVVIFLPCYDKRYVAVHIACEQGEGKEKGSGKRGACRNGQGFQFSVTTYINKPTAKTMISYNASHYIGVNLQK